MDGKSAWFSVGFVFTSFFHIERALFDVYVIYLQHFVIKLLFIRYDFDVLVIEFIHAIYKLHIKSSSRTQYMREEHWNQICF